MPKSQSITASYHSFILVFVVIKLLLNLLVGDNYGFHRDEMLYLTMGDHLAWGYMEVPPFIALLSKISLLLFGPTSVAGLRVFTAIASALMVWFTGLLVTEFGGKRFAISLACLSLIFSPGMAASSYLFQPVVFDQLWWLIAAWLLVKYANKQQAPYLYWLGVVVGVGLLTKYTMAFFTGALLLGLLLTPSRKWLWRKETGIAVLLAIIIFLPNILWQYHHHWPLLTHMQKLKVEQLNYVKPTDFVAAQFMLHATTVLVWLAGLLFLLFHKSMRRYRFVGLAYLFVFTFLLVMNGKAYYLLAAYPMLLAAGGCAWAFIIKNATARLISTILLIVPNLLLVPVLMPVLTIHQVQQFFKYTTRHLLALNFAITWEDQKKHPITQDYADMLGWEELVAKVSATYHKLSPEQQKRTVIFTDNYGEAGAIHVYRHQYNLPDVVCLNSSFALWAPANLEADYIIYVSDDDDVSDLKPVVASYKRTGGVENMLAREQGTGIYLVQHPSKVLGGIYQQHLKEALGE
ncbi:glycosyltransferase family 39 protein [Mucilaginibacter sp. Bleaf8]|uniref:ArnT family glycosyltransferase n=1 Tax=Mucilaginibacter sp. Bleaf8 TaxID=2834430 RepID=UPI001BCEADA1|nr:glycosyltransferase family 39 protein [Mucilaginibacter sp. Bleaf8]MBS7565292.1 glycosyltransferase family 39 protein [Mucilaginibacter sp. Bleaf8]